MKGLYVYSIEERCVMLANYLIENRATVRAVAKAFGVSKSTVHKDVTQVLKDVDSKLYLQTKEILEINKSEIIIIEEIFEMYKVSSGKIGKKHTECYRHKEKRLEFFYNGKIE